ncbi:DUF4855 domain-containing protein [Niabella sp. CC-SYL272]|uniref:DUF4855 domain-containing protein n=1 Tax=Niabella agricola TaxID=2891571 RepID=UPI001F1623E4|nr:DUF4855 domain-containing protein [Niabella agricola]MCF3108673.1 DUF4855 domain-containing protein [Niabella agricola]
MLKRTFILCCLFIGGLVVAVACSRKANTPGEVVPDPPEMPVKPGPRFPVDLALIYHGNGDRPEWNKDQLKPYVYRMQNGKLQWQFDGFLFLEITARIDGKFYDFGVAPAAGKMQWQWLLDRTFADGKGPDALEEVMDGLAKQGYRAPYKRKVIISIPNPVYGDTAWGILKGKKLDFKNNDDRIAASKWYMDQVLQIWNTKNYKYLDFAGFYWLSESVDYASDADVMKATSTYVRDKKKDFYWIPYYGAGRARDWRALGLDIAHQQPNYFFDLKSPYTILTGGISFAQQHQMALEMEFDDRLATDKGYMGKFYDYLNEYAKQGIFDTKPVAYYEGGGAWLRMSLNKDTAVQRAFNTLGDILARRKEKDITFQ